MIFLKWLRRRRQPEAHSKKPADEFTSLTLAAAAIKPGRPRREGESYNAFIASSLGALFKRSSLMRETIAERMSEELGETVSKPMLDQYASCKASGHHLTVPRLIGLIRASEDLSLLAAIAGELGCYVIPHNIDLFLEAALAREQAAEAQRRADSITARCEESVTLGLGRRR